METSVKSDFVKLYNCPVASAVEPSHVKTFIHHIIVLSHTGEEKVVKSRTHVSGEAQRARRYWFIECSKKPQAYSLAGPRLSDVVDWLTEWLKTSGWWSKGGLLLKRESRSSTDQKVGGLILGRDTEPQIAPWWLCCTWMLCRNVCVNGLIAKLYCKELWAVIKTRKALKYKPFTFTYCEQHTFLHEVKS